MKRFLVLILALACVTSRADDDVATYLQRISVTISAAGSQGSGVTFLRDGVSYVWTAAHVVDGLRKTREVVDGKTGTKRTIVEFEDARVVRILGEDGRTVGRIEYDAEVIRYSNADTGEDLALLRVRKKGFADDTGKFFLDDRIPPIGTNLFHVGSLLGSQGSNSMTSGILSQHGRLINKKIFDQSTCAAFPGCLTAETMVQLADGSEKPIIDIQEGDEVLTLDNRVVMADGTWSKNVEQGDYVMTFQTITGGVEKRGTLGNRAVTKGRVEAVWATGIKPVLKISTRNRSVRATGNHPFVRVVTIHSIDQHTYHVAEWCRADQLKPGDIVAVMERHTPFKKSEGLNLTHSFGKTTNHLPMMRLAGFYVGDGYSRLREGKGGEVNLYTFNNVDTARYSEILKSCCNLIAHVGKSPSGTFIRVSSVRLATLFKSLQLTGNALTKRIPSWVFKVPSEMQREFIEGYVDADGHRRSGYFSLESANRELIDDFRSLAFNLGMAASNIRQRDRLAIIEGGREIQSRSFGADVYPDPTKSGAQMNGTRLLPEGLKFERIASIEPDGEEMTYDMTVGQYHNFFANGFLVHNSSGGGVFLTDGRYIGMLVRGAGETFNLTVPVRRMRNWATTAGVLWAIDPNVPVPPRADLDKMPIEDNGVEFAITNSKADANSQSSEFEFLIQRQDDSPRDDE